MGLIKCRECQAEVSELAKTCPQCGISSPLQFIYEGKIASRIAWAICIPLAVVGFWLAPELIARLEAPSQLLYAVPLAAWAVCFIPVIIYQRSSYNNWRQNSLEETFEDLDRFSKKNVAWDENSRRQVIDVYDNILSQPELTPAQRRRIESSKRAFLDRQSAA